MWLADKWKDYTVIDTSDGEKLELWGKYSLIRPDPQVIWKTEKKHPLWKHADASYKRSKSGGGAWSENKLPETWNISYKDLTFQIKPMGFKHTGLFPEQAVNWDWMARRLQGMENPRVLNLFAYTGGATVACAAAGAEVVHVDAAKGMVQWAGENAALSGLAERPIRYIIDDCLKFVRREQRRGRTYHGIVMDPPAYGRGPGGEMWKLEDEVFTLVQEAARLLDEDAAFFLLNSYTTGLGAAAMENMLRIAILPQLGGICAADEVGLPVEARSLVLPCGNTARWCPK